MKQSENIFKYLKQNNNNVALINSSYYELITFIVVDLGVLILGKTYADE